MKERYEGPPPENLSKEQERNVRIREAEEQLLAAEKMARIDARALDEWPLPADAVTELSGPVNETPTELPSEKVKEIPVRPVPKAPNKILAWRTVSKEKTSERETPPVAGSNFERTKEFGWLADRLDGRTFRMFAGKIEIEINMSSSAVTVFVTPRRGFPGSTSIVLGILETIAHDTGRGSTQAKQLPDGRICLAGVFTLDKEHYEDDLKRLKADRVTTLFGG